MTGIDIRSLSGDRETEPVKRTAENVELPLQVSSDISRRER